MQRFKVRKNISNRTNQEHKLDDSTVPSVNIKKPQIIIEKDQINTHKTVLEVEKDSKQQSQGKINDRPIIIPVISKTPVNTKISNNLSDDQDSDKENIPLETKRKSNISPPLLIDSRPKKFKSVKSTKNNEISVIGVGPISNLELPDKYQKLVRLFNALDGILLYLKQKHQVCVFHSVKKSVELNSNRTFSVPDFQMMMSVCPKLFETRPFYLKNEEIDSFTIEYPETKETGNIFELFKQIPSRRLDFEMRLLDRTKLHHEQFIKDQGLVWEFDPIKPTWHPDFDLNSVPDIELAEIPIKKHESYLEKWKKSNGLNDNKPIKEKVNEDKSADIAENKSTPKSEIISESLNKDNSPSNNTNEPQTDQKLTEKQPTKPLSRAAALLQRIREKEAKNAQLNANKPTIEEQKKQSMLSRLRPISSTLLSYLKSNGKSAIKVSLAIKQLQQSKPDYYLTDDQWFEHLKLLASLVPGFCSLEGLVGVKSPKIKEDFIIKLHIGGKLQQVLDAVNATKK